MKSQFIVECRLHDDPTFEINGRARRRPRLWEGRRAAVSFGPSVRWYRDGGDNGGGNKPNETQAWPRIDAKRSIHTAHRRHDRPRQTRN